MVDLKEVFAENLRQLRRKRGWTQEELADRSGLSSRFIGSVERAQASPTITVLGQLAAALEIDPAELFRRR